MKPLLSTREMPEFEGHIIVTDASILRSQDVYRFKGESIWNVAQRTENPEVARKLLVDKDRLFRVLMSRYTRGHFGDEWLENHRKSSAEKIINRLERLIAPSATDRVIGFIRDFRIAKLFGERQDP